MTKSMATGNRKKRKRHPNPCRAKTYLSYTVEEIARLYGTHRNTVRAWVKAGLPTCDEKRPKLILGRHLRAFLQVRRTKNKRSCRPEEIYCVRCRSPKLPAGGMAEYQPVTEKVGNLLAICPDCDSIIHRLVSFAKLGQVRGKIDITFPQGLRRLIENNQPTVNSDLG